MVGVDEANNSVNEDVEEENTLIRKSLIWIKIKV
jgi:hypothetical protein